MAKKEKLPVVYRVLKAALEDSKKKLAAVKAEQAVPSPSLQISRLRLQRIDVYGAEVSASLKLRQLTEIEAQIEALEKKAKRFSFGKLIDREYELESDIRQLEEALWYHALRRGSSSIESAMELGPDEDDELD